MGDESVEGREEYLKRLLTQMSPLADALRVIEEGGAGDYAETYKKLSELREGYRQLTGLYPMLPPSWRASESAGQPNNYESRLGSRLMLARSAFIFPFFARRISIP